jgi:hypothetical protein
MQSTIRPDIAKSVFQGHGVDAAGRVVLRRHPHGACAASPPPSCASAPHAVSAGLELFRARIDLVFSTRKSGTDKRWGALF